MTTRSTELQAFLDALQAALAVGAPPGSGDAAAADRASAALVDPAPGETPRRTVQHACRVLPDALANARELGMASLADAFAAIEPGLAWHAREDRVGADANFPTSHANAVIVGAGGLEPRADVRIGVSLMAPHTAYPNHRHPPEEVYVSMSAGHWRQERGPWFEPGPGGTVYNEPNIVHAMRSGEAPLLAIWTLNMPAK